MKKRFLSILLTLTLITSSFAFTPAHALAAYDDKIEAFTYNGYSIPAYDGDICEVINNNDPLFKASEMTTTPFEDYSTLDELGRCGEAYANVCQEIMPTEERGDIGSVKPTGWIQAKYDFVDGKYLYNRCHLVGFQLAGENANTKNLITGTRALNNDGMLPFENDIADYVEDTDHHVLYRVTPIFDGDNLLADGVLLEADSVEDDGIEFCVFIYNVQDGVTINYATGESMLTSDVNDALYNIKNADITLSYTSTTYTGSYKRPTVTVKMNDKKLVKDTDYTFTYSNNKKAGTALVKIIGKGSYYGEATRSFKINARSVASSDVKISSISNKTYTGSQIRPTVTVKYNGNKLVKGTDYTVTYGTNKSTGKGIVTVKGIGNFKESKQITFKIVPKKVAISSTAGKKKAIYAKWNKPTGTTGFQVAYRKKDSSSWNYKTTKNTAITISSLTGNKNYQFKVRAYKLVGDSKYYGSWSTIKTIKTLSSTSVTTTVYTTATGTKYHSTKSCRGLANANKIYSTSLSNAKSQGLEPCKLCH